MKRLPIIGLLTLSVIFGFQLQPAFAQTEQTEGTRKVSTKVVPMYPQLARTMSLRGTVRLEALVLANGTVKSVQVKGGNPLLVQSAQNAIREWKWAKAEHETTELVEFKFQP
jgi:TonB family protein